MLQESFVASSSSPAKSISSNAALLRDAGIFVHSFRPQSALVATFKKNASPRNCSAITESHIFAAQAEKAVIHVYNRAKGSQEVTVPFPERIQSVEIILDGAGLALGTEGGGIILWETCTGRQLSTSRAHLQPVTILTVDMSGNFLLSGSDDSNILVWSLLDLLSFPSASAMGDQSPGTPLRELSGHRNGITDIVAGHSTTSINIAISASRDNTAIMWNYHTSDQLRTFLLSSTPLCLALDPADRACYVGYEDGSVQIISFYNSLSAKSIHDSTNSSIPIQPLESTKIMPSATSGPTTHNASTDSTLSMALSYTGTSLISGHASGKIHHWDTGAGGSFQSTLADYSGAPITNLHFLPPTGFANHTPLRLAHRAIVKPRPQETFSSSQGQLAATYVLTSQLPTRLQSSTAKTAEDDFETLLTSPLFPDSLLHDSIIDLHAWNPNDGASTSASSAQRRDADHASDFLPLTDADEEEASRRKEEIVHLRAQVSHLRRLQQVSNDHVDRLVRENAELARILSNREGGRDDDVVNKNITSAMELDSR